MESMVLEALYNIEPHAEERIKQAKAKAKRVAAGIPADSDEVQLCLQYIISKHYGIPIFDPYFNDRTLDDTVFEAELITFSKQGSHEQSSSIINDHKAEADALFDDWDETAHNDTWEPVADFSPEAPPSVNWDEEYKRFAETDQFKE